MQKYCLIFMVSLLLTLAGCANSAKISTKFLDQDQDGVAEQTVVNAANLTQRSFRYRLKTDMTMTLCRIGAELHNEQRIIAQVYPFIIIDGKAVEPPKGTATTFYNHDVKPFNMAGCIAESMRWPFERVVMQLTHLVEKALTLGLKTYGAYKLLKAVTQNSGTVVNGDNNRVGSSRSGNVDIRQDQAGDASTYNTCSGELVDGQCVQPSEEPAPVDGPACELPADCADVGSYADGSCGTVDPDILACLGG